MDPWLWLSQSCSSFFLLMLVFVLQWFSLHWEILIILLSQFIWFPSNSKWDDLFHHITYDYSCVDWYGLHDHLRNVPRRILLKSVPLLLLVNFSETSWTHLKLYKLFLLLSLLRPFLLSFCLQSSSSPYSLFISLLFLLRIAIWFYLSPIN